MVSKSNFNHAAVGAAIWSALLALYMVLPDQTIDPLGAINPRSILLVVLLITGINACGQVIAHLFGSRHGLPLAGFLSGFISSSATIGVMGRAARDLPDAHAAAAAGAVLSTVATFLQLVLLLAATNPHVLEHIAPVLIAGGASAALYGLYFILRAHRGKAIALPDQKSSAGFALALSFAAIVTGISVFVALLNLWLGESGIVLGAVASGFADVHAATASLITLVNNGAIPDVAIIPAIVAAITSNTCTKAFLAYHLGSPAFAREVITGLLLVIFAVWGAAAFVIFA